LGLDINSRIEEEMSYYQFLLLVFYLLDQNWKIWAH